MRITLISSGAELLRGDIVDTNNPFLARWLDQRGHQVTLMEVLPDQRETVIDTLQQAAKQNDLVIFTGGLGPTSDDLTREAAAIAFNRPLQAHPTAKAQVEAFFSERDRPMAAINLRQAQIPKGANVLDNPIGTAPGFSLVQNGCTLVFLPGVPAELEAMTPRHLAPLVPQLTRNRRAIYQLFGIGESRLQELVTPLEAATPQVTFGYRAHFPTLQLSLSGPQTAVQSATQRLDPLLTPYLISTDENTLAQTLVQTLHAANLLIGTAESCTGGLIAHQITQVAGASAVFGGAVVAYQNSIKTGLLGVDAQALNNYGAVSKQVVTQMAQGACKKIGTDLAVATSGIAGPTGATPGKPVGTVHLALARRGNEVVLHKKCLFKGMDRTKVKIAAATTAMKMVLDHIRNNR